MKPSGYWKDTENVRKEIDTFNLEHGAPGVMPKENDLKAHRFGSLANAIHQHGGFKKFAADHGYETKRKPNGYWKVFANLQRELLTWVEAHGEQGVMPTTQQLKDAMPPRHDLVDAIGRHGGFMEVAGRATLRMSHNKKPDGHYAEIANVAREIYAFVDEHGLSGMMPTASELSGAGRSGLVQAVILHGGFPQVAQQLGLTPNRKQKGYWTEETIDFEVREHLRRVGIAGAMPTDSELRASGRADLAVAISRFGGGTRAIAERLGLQSRAQKPDGYWDDPAVVDREVLEFARGCGTPGIMPTQGELYLAGRADLVNAISRSGGGWPAVADRLRLDLVQQPKNYWSDIGTAKAELLAYNERRGRPGEMPTKTDLDLAGEFSLGAAIEKLGGYPAVAAMFGLSASEISLRPRSREELVLAYELALFFHFELEEHKVRVAGKTYDVDILIRPLQLIVEYDSYHWHEGTRLQDERKTKALEESGWRVIRVREEPLPRIRPGCVLVRKGHSKETSNRVLLRIQELLGTPIEGLEGYLTRNDLQNIGRCEECIANILRTRRGRVVEGEHRENGSGDQ